MCIKFLESIQSICESCTNPMPLVWYQAYKMSICGDFLKSRYVYLLSGYIGMHKAVSIERVLSMTFSYPNQWAVGPILKVMLVVFEIGEYWIILHPKVGVRIRLGVWMWNVYLRSSRYYKGIASWRFCSGYARQRFERLMRLLVLEQDAVTLVNSEVT